VHDDLLDRGATRRGVDSISAIGRDQFALLVATTSSEAFLLAARAATSVAEKGAAVEALGVGQPLEPHFDDVARGLAEHRAAAPAGPPAAWCRVATGRQGTREFRRAQLGEFGLAFGMAFRFVDHLLGVVADYEAIRAIRPGPTSERARSPSRSSSPCCCVTTAPSGPTSVAENAKCDHSGLAACIDEVRANSALDATLRLRLTHANAASLAIRAANDRGVLVLLAEVPERFVATVTSWFIAGVCSSLTEAAECHQLAAVGQIKCRRGGNWGWVDEP
jgi:hypothetical protein